MQILLAWELGGNYGHLAKLICIARPLRQKGHHVLFAVKNRTSAGKLLESEGFSYIQAPRPVLPKPRFPWPGSFADILAGAGFGSSEGLEGLVRSWQEIFKNMQADVLVAQYAPVAQFSARLSGLPCLSLSTGFEHPPDIQPFPSFRPQLRLTREHLLARETKILQQVNSIRFDKVHLFLKSLPQILASDINLLVTFPELDHYPLRQKGCYIGPLSMLDYGQSLCWSKESTTRIFLYLRPFQGIEQILKLLAASGADVIAHIPGIDRQIVSSYDNTSIRIIGSMVKLSSVLVDMDVAITHGGHGTAAATLLAGVPMLMIPTTIEQWMMSRAIEKLGIGISLRKKMLAETLSAALARLLTDQAIKQMSKTMAAKYAGYNQQRVVARLVNTIERLPAWKDNSL